MELEKSNRVMMMRDYRKGNWTLEETMVLIEAKKLDEQRRMLKNNPNAQSTSSSSTMKPSSSGELRWKWIEEHCWKKGCLRSQNQCNDKWDNLMRDFKKIREYERRNNNDNEDDTNKKSYWTMDKIERKDNNLPTNMLPQLYHALANVVESKLGSTISVLPTIVFNPCSTTTTTTTTPLPLPPPPPLLLPPSPPPSAFPTQESSTKRKKPSDGERSISEEISTSSSLLIEAIKGFEEREEIRHKELYDLHQKRYKLDESKIELERQGFDKLVDAINNLSNSIIAFTSQRTRL